MSVCFARIIPQLTVEASSVAGAFVALTVAVLEGGLFCRARIGFVPRQGMARVFAMDGHMSVVTAEMFCDVRLD